MLEAGPVTIDRFWDRPGDELLAVFRDDMRAIRRVPARQFLGSGEFFRETRKNPGLDGEEIEVTEFRAPGRAAAARLDLLGIDEKSVLERLSGQLRHPRPRPAQGLLAPGRFVFPRTRRRFVEAEEYYRAEAERADEFRASMGADGWVAMLASSPSEPGFRWDAGTGGRSWLLDELTGWDPRYALRAVLLAFPGSDAVLATADIAQGAEQPQPASLPSAAMAAVSARAGAYAPVVVLTEGKTDAEFLAAGLKVLRPHLTDLIRFLDYGRKPQGGAGALATTVKAFAAAGIANRVVAVFDNDTAGADAMRPLATARLPPQIQVIAYPDLDLAREYPVLGPSTAESPGGTLLSDVNGLAASIELYLGRDVLTGPDGTLRPVRWRPGQPGAGRRQGEVTGKDAIQQAFRAKSKAALENPANAGQQDWSGLRLIIDAICAAAQSARTDR